MIMPPPPNLDELLHTEIYPGIDPYESKVINAYLTRHGFQFDRIDFNYKLGDGQPAPENTPEPYRKMWESVTRKRADCVCWREPDRAVIVEAKWTFHLRDVGQLLGYGELFRKQHPQYRAALVAICAVIDGDVQSVLTKYGASIIRYDIPADRMPAAPVDDREEL